MSIAEPAFLGPVVLFVLEMDPHIDSFPDGCGKEVFLLFELRFLWAVFNKELICF